MEGFLGSVGIVYQYTVLLYCGKGFNTITDLDAGLMPPHTWMQNINLSATFSCAYVCLMHASGMYITNSGYI